MDQQDSRNDPNRVTAGDVPPMQLDGERRTLSVGATAAIILAAIAVLMIGLTYLSTDNRTAQKTDVPSSSDRVTTPPSGTTGTAPPPATSVPPR
jgi:hypothetical protein